MLVRKKIIYPKLEATLRAQGYNYRSLAEALGVTPSYIAKRMAGEIKWDVDVAFKVAELLGSTVDKLFRKENV